jgi:hypothetical protein
MNIWVGNFKARIHVGDLGAGQMIILKIKLGKIA